MFTTLPGLTVLVHGQACRVFVNSSKINRNLIRISPAMGILQSFDL